MTYGMAAFNPWIRRAIWHYWEIDLYDLDRRDECMTLALDREGNPVALHAFEIIRGVVHSRLTYVKKSHRGQGYGSALWRETMRWTGARSANGYAASLGGARLLWSLRGKVKGNLNTEQFDVPRKMRMRAA